MQFVILTTCRKFKNQSFQCMIKFGHDNTNMLTGKDNLY